MSDPDLEALRDKQSLAAIAAGQPDPHPRPAKSVKAKRAWPRREEISREEIVFPLGASDEDHDKAFTLGLKFWHDEIAALFQSLNIGPDDSVSFARLAMVLAEIKLEVQWANDRIDASREKREALAQRLEAIEARGIKFMGTYQRAIDYTRGSVVVSKGSSWIALKPTSDEPGASDTWALMAKAGKDAR